MSVINKMLRDLDQRQSAQAGAHAGTASVAARALPVRKPAARGVRWGRVLLGGGALCALAALGAWQLGWLSPLRPAAAPVVVPVATAPAVPVTALSSPGADSGVATAPGLSVPVPVAEVPAPVVSPPPVPAAVSVPAAAPVAVSKAPASAASTPNLRMEAALAKPAAKAASAASPAAAPTMVPGTRAPASTQAEPPSSLQRQQFAAKETLAQAQTLWNTGSHEAAMDLLQEAVLTVERNAANTGNSAQLLPPLVRELSRMQLAEGRPAAVVDLLSRLEPLLRNEPELWAVRANAAQRLGRHQDSLQAYTTALQFRPNEQRWLLGAAVSLAALGQTANAAEMADKARSVGPISREVLAYLRQAGVPVKD